MSFDNLWPSVGPLLQAAYLDRRRAWIEAHPDVVTPWPKRRTSRRKPLPGLYEAATDSEG